MSQMFARGLIITPLDEDGRPYYELNGDKIKINVPGVYSISGDMPSRFSAGHVVEISLPDDETNSDAALVLTEVCRALHGRSILPNVQERVVHQVVSNLSGLFPNGVMLIPGNLINRGQDGEHLHVYASDEEGDDEPVDVEQLTSIRTGMALRWLQEGTLDLPSLAASAGMSVDQGTHQHDVLRVRPAAPRVSQAFQMVTDGPEGKRVCLDSRTLDVASDVRTQLAGPDNPYPGVWLTQRSGQNLRVRLDRSATEDGPMVEVWAYQEGGTTPADVVARDTIADQVRTATADLRRDLADAEATARRRLDCANEQARTLKRVGEFLHDQSDRIEVHARRLPDDGSSAYYALCDIMVKLRETARDECGVAYARTASLDEPMRHEGTPWPLREWALLARQTMEQLSGQLGHVAGSGIVNKARETMREVVAEYPEDLDAVQAEQAARNADDEAVRRLSHAMTEVANALDTHTGETLSHTVIPSDLLVQAVSKLQRTVNTWTTEEQRRPWAAEGEPVETEALQGPRGDVTVADLPGNLVNTLHGMASFLDRHRGRFSGDDAVKAALWRYQLRKFLGLE